MRTLSSVCRFAAARDLSLQDIENTSVAPADGWPKPTVATSLLKHIREMNTSMRSDRGFSINELMLTVAVAATLMAIAVPILTDVGEGARFNASVRMVERE